MAKVGRSLNDLAAEITRRAEAKEDYVAPVSKLSMTVVNDKPALAMANGEVKTFEVNDVAGNQIAEYAGIPMPYFRRMVSEDPALLAQNVNRWFADKAKAGEKRMVRLLDGRNRAFLSDRYRPLENEDLAQAVLPVLLNMNLLILSCEITDTRLYIKAVDKSIERDVPTGKAMGDGEHNIFDTCSPGLVVSNSEVGMGMLSVETCVYTRGCTNLALFGSNLKRRHTGARQGFLTDDVYAMLTDETKAASDKAIFMQVTDLVKAGFEEAKFDALVQKMGKAAGDKVQPEAAVEVIERVGRKFSLNEGERKGILGALIAGGDLSRYGVHSAVTRYSQAETIAYDRATQLERFGGEIIDLAPSEWKVIAEPVAA